MGVDGVPSMNIEEDKDNDRKLKEERLIESMEEQLYKIRSVNSSPSKQSTPSETNKTSIPSPQNSPNKNNKRAIGERMKQNHVSPEVPSAFSIRRRSESLPPPMKRYVEVSSAEHQLRKIPYPSFASEKSEPSRTYSHELSAIKKPEDDFSLKSSNFSNGNYAMKNDVFSNQLKKGQPYSSSLENLDPSAKEFLVDAGVILDNMGPLSRAVATNDANFILPSGTSLPNLSKTENNGQNDLSQSHVPSNILPYAKSTPIALHANMETFNQSMKANDILDSYGKNSSVDNDFSKYLISNEEMKKYEAEYQKASIALKTADSMNLQKISSVVDSRPYNNMINSSEVHNERTIENISRDAQRYDPNNGSIDNSVQTSANENTISETLQDTQVPAVPALDMPTVKKLDSPSNDGVEKKSLQNITIPNHSNSSKYSDTNPKKFTSDQVSTPVPTSGTGTKTDAIQSPTDAASTLLDNYESLTQATNMLTKLAIPSKIATSAVNTNNGIMDSIGKFAEKLEAKRRSIVAATSGSPNVDNKVQEMVDGAEKQHPFEIVSKQNRATIMENKLQAIKAQGITPKKSLLKPPGSLTTPTKQVGYAHVHKRLSLTEQMNAAVVNNHAMQRLMTPRHQQQKVSRVDSAGSSSEGLATHSSESSEEKNSESSSGSSDQDEPKVTHLLQHVRRMASMDDTGPHRNSIPKISSRESVGNYEPRKRLPQPPSAPNQALVYLGDSDESLDMATYVPPLTNERQFMGSYATPPTFSDSQNSISSSNILVVKPIENRKGTEYYQSVPETPRKERMYPSTTRSMYVQHPPRSLPQVPKPSTVGHRQQSSTPAPPNVGNGNLKRSSQGTIQKEIAFSNNSNMKQYQQQNLNQYPIEKQLKPNHPPPPYRNPDTMPIDPPAQGRYVQPKQQPQINLSKPSRTTNFLSHQEYSDMNPVYVSESSNTHTPNSANQSQVPGGRYRCPPPYPFSPPPPPTSLREKTPIEAVNSSKNLSESSMEGNKPTEHPVEFQKPQVSSNQSRFTKMPPPRYRPHQPPSVQKRLIPSGGSSNEQNSVATPNHPGSSLAEGNKTNRSSFGGVPSRSPTVFNRQSHTQVGLKPNEKYGKSLSAESILFTERIRSIDESNSSMEYSNGADISQLTDEDKESQHIFSHPQSIPRPKRANSQSAVNIKQHSIAQARTVSTRSETPLPTKMEVNNRPVPRGPNLQSFAQNHPKGSPLETTRPDQNYKKKPMSLAMMTQEQTMQPRNAVTLSHSSRTSMPQSKTPGTQSTQQQVATGTVAASLVTPSTQQRRSSGIRMWQNGNNQKGGVNPPLQSHPAAPRYLQHGSKPGQLIRQSSEDNVRRSPSPSLHQRMQTQEINTNSNIMRPAVYHGNVPVSMQNVSVNTSPLQRIQPLGKPDNKKSQPTLKPKMNGIPQPSRNMSYSSPNARGTSPSPAMLQKNTNGTRTRPNSMHNSPGSSRPSSPHLHVGRTQIAQQNTQQNIQSQKRRSYQYPPSSMAEGLPRQPYGSTGSLQNVRTQQQIESRPNPIPTQVNRPQSADYLPQMYTHPTTQPSTSLKTAPSPNAIPLPKRNTGHSENTPMKLQRNSLSAQHYMTKRPQQIGQLVQPQKIQGVPVTQQQGPTPHHQQISSNKSSVVYNIQPRPNGQSSLPMPRFSSKIGIPKRKS